MLEENVETCLHVLDVTDVDLMTLAMLPHISDVESAFFVGYPCLSSTWCDVCLDLASKWCEGVCGVVMFTP